LFFQSYPINNSLLELKFRELMMHVTANPANKDITNFFLSLKSDDSLGRMQRTMEENFCFNLPLEDYARLCGKSLSSFKRSFEEHYGQPPGRWLMDKRLHHARSLIQLTTKTMAEVAFESGFENASHFSRAYRRRFGETPRASREKVE
jgi:transcriptional regulator GlxA family with amidase domain